MRCISKQSLKKIAAACIFSGLIAGGICILTSISATNAAAPHTISVNRTLKSDRLPQPPVVQESEQHYSPIERAPSFKHTPGCEPSFSPVVNPEQAHYLGRCMA